MNNRLVLIALLAIASFPTARAQQIQTQFGTSGFGFWTMDTNDLVTASYIIPPAMSLANLVQTDNNIGIYVGMPVTFSNPVFFEEGSTFTMSFTTPEEGDFNIDATVTSSLLLADYVREVTGIGTVYNTDPTSPFTPSPVSWTSTFNQLNGPGTLVNGAFTWSSPIPEPSSFALLALGAFFTLRRRRSSL